MERIEMSQEERDKLEWLKRARDKLVSQSEAARRIGVSDRWVRKLLGRMKKHGDSGVPGVRKPQVSVPGLDIRVCGRSGRP